MDIIKFKERFEYKQVVEEPNAVTQDPLVSVCVQTYQHANFIGECLDSILMQETNFEYEILLGEDASTDGTREICKEYAEKYPDKIRLFLHHRENNIAIGGSPTGRFILMTNIFSANGKYIALCEGDDYWTDSSKLQKQVDVLESNSKFSACFTNALIIIDQESKKSWKPFIKNEVPNNYNFKDILRRGGGFFPTATLVFKNNIINFPDFFCEVKSGDRALAMLLGDQGNFYYLNKIMAMYRLHGGGTFTGIATNNEKRIEIDLNNLELLSNFNEYTNFKHNKDVIEVISNYSQRILNKYSSDLIADRKDYLLANLNFRDKLRLIKNRLTKKTE